MIEPISRCPFCSIPYDPERVQTISHMNQRDVVHATCLSCQRAMVFAIERREEHVACVGLFTDCDADDARRFLERPKISLDDVLRVHELLSQETRG